MKHRWRELDIDEQESCQSTAICERCGELSGWLAMDDLDQVITRPCKPRDAKQEDQECE